jgi:hypothetical protein
MIRKELDKERVFAIHDFLSQRECVELIQRSEKLTWEVGTVGGEVVGGVRNNERVMFDDSPLAADLFHRAQPFLPDEIDGLRLVGLNERWRFYRYRPGHTFKPHRDGMYQRLELWEESHLTFMIYLNGRMTGGQTRFFVGMEEAFRGQPYLSVEPKEGMALVFVHRIWHEGALVESGQKYVLRTDVMYGPAAKPSTWTAEPAAAPDRGGDR